MLVNANFSECVGVLNGKSCAAGMTLSVFFGFGHVSPQQPDRRSSDPLATQRVHMRCAVDWYLRVLLGGSHARRVVAPRPARGRVRDIDELGLLDDPRGRARDVVCES